jgi:hypothetical protein
MEYAHRKALVNVERAEDDGFLDTISGLQVIRKGDLISTNEFGHSNVINEEDFHENYIKVKRLSKPKTPRKSMDEIAEAYKQAWINQDDYIFETK